MSEHPTAGERGFPLPLFTVSRHGRIREFNDEVGKLLRAANEQIARMPLTVFLSSPFHQAFLSYLWEAFQRPGESFTLEVEFKRYDETLQRAELHSQVPLNNDAVCHVVAVARPPLGQDQSFSLELMEKLPYGVAWLDKNECLVESNRSLCELLDFHPDQLRVCPVSRVFIDWDSERALGAALRGRPFRVQGVSRAGVTIPVEAFLRPTNLENARRHYLFVVRDLREQEEIERRSLRIAELERQAIGRDLHDALGQNLVGMAFLADELASAIRRPDSDPTANAERATRLAGLSRQVIATSRDLVRGLYPSGMVEGGLPAALKQLAHSATDNTRVRCVARCGDTQLPREVEEHLFRIAQEAVTNALKHARCANIVITLTVDSEAILLTVEDDGQGIKVRQHQRLGSGINSMRHRCQLIGAVFSIARCTPICGTRVAIRLPKASIPIVSELRESNGAKSEV